jgi:glutamate--cysteine ligase
VRAHDRRDEADVEVHVLNCPLTEATAAAWIYDQSFRTDRIGTIGVELEWLAYVSDGSTSRPCIDRITAAMGSAYPRLPNGSAVSFEPGGQIELSSAPARSILDCVNRVIDDVRVMRSRLRANDVYLVGSGLDRRRPVRLIDSARYRMLESHYDRFGRYGRIMMCNAASVQVSVDAGDDSPGWRGRGFRWRLANGLGPILLAIFANSPGPGTKPWQSTRQVYRFRTDPTRTDPLPLENDPRETWTSYALKAQVVGVEDQSGQWRSGQGLTLRDWLRGRGSRPLMHDDLVRHLKTVIPPVRPCGRLEFRMIDAQPSDSWIVPVAVVGTLMDEQRCAERASAVVASLPPPTHPGHWLTAADGLRLGGLARAAVECMGIAIDGLARMGAPSWLTVQVASFLDTYTRRGLSPAADRGNARLVPRGAM